MASIKTTILTAAAAVTLAAGLGTAGTLPAHAATPGCGQDCIDIFSQAFSGSYLDVPNQANPQVGSAVNLAPGSATNPGEDFALGSGDTVHDFFLAGIVGAALNARYGNLLAYEFDFAPFGAETGNCLGVPSTPFYGTSVELEPCGVSSNTLWIPVPVTTSTSTDLEFINGSETFRFNTPFVLTAFSPRSDLLLWPLQTSFFNRTVPSDQLWGALQGVLPSTTPVPLNLPPTPAR